ncbi:50S ribosomal protein L6 [candidate division KSB1 bacterium]|nr:50S ribosomal protein L6 [candidate division KSB1 bacterium]
MSRIGKKPISVPEGVDIKFDRTSVTVSKGGKLLRQDISPDFKLEMDEKERTLTVSRPSDNKIHRSLHGLYRALISNMITGLNSGFEKKLEIIGVGYRAEMKGKSLLLNIGYSHPILFRPPEEIDVSLESPTAITVKGYNKQLVGQVAAKIRSFRPPEPYKGKGIRYSGEYVRRKAGKAAG